jgi:hypothetical protein
MRYLKTFEKLIKMRPIRIGYEYYNGALGILLSPEYENYITALIKYFIKNKIEYRLFFENNFLFIIDPISTKDIPCDKTEVTLKYYIPPLNNDDTELYLSWYYQDIFDAVNWDEIIIESEEDIEDITMIINAKKYNL